MKSFRELLLESPMRIKGNAPFETLDGFTKSKRAMFDEYDYLEKFNKGEIFIHKKKNLLVVAIPYIDEVSNTDRYSIVAELSFSHETFRSTTHEILKRRDVISINTVHVKETHRQLGIASVLYKILLKKYNVMSDKLQYEKAALMWKNFATETDNVIYIYDANKDEIISKMSTKTPDSHIWSEDTTKIHIRMVMVNA